MTKTKKNRSSTPYDDIFRTLVNGPPQPLLGLLNEMFETKYTGDEQVKHMKGQFFITKEEGKRKRITDSHFSVSDGSGTQYYHLECQTHNDGSILIRMFEYDSLIALSHSEKAGDTLHLHLPKSGILYLADVPPFSPLYIEIVASQGMIRHEIRVLSMKDYSIDSIFERDLYFLVPFYVFTYQLTIQMIEKDQQKTRQFYEDLHTVLDKIKTRYLSGKISGSVYAMLSSLMKEMFDSYLSDYSTIKTEVKKIMGGNVIEIESLKPYFEGKQEGIKEGKLLGKEELIDSLLTQNLISKQQAEELRSKIRSL